jgi:hypothetical protein
MAAKNATALLACHVENTRCRDLSQIGREYVQTMDEKQRSPTPGETWATAAFIFAMLATHVLLDS